MAQGWEEEDMGASYGSPAQWGAGWALAQCGGGVCVVQIRWLNHVTWLAKTGFGFEPRLTKPRSSFSLTIISEGRRRCV